MVKALKNRLYEDFSTMIMFEANRVVNARYSEGARRDFSHETYGQDAISCALFEDLTKRSSIWKRIKSSKQLVRNLIALILAGYMGIRERGAYLNALLPNSDVEDLIRALKSSGPSLPKTIQDRIKQMEPISELKNSLTKELMTWGDIWTVRMMGRIGNKEFVPDLIHVLRISDSMDYIYTDAIWAMNALEESADAMLLDAIKSGELV